MEEAEKKAAIISKKCNALQEYAAKNDYDTSIGFLLDFNIPSGNKRFFVCDLSSGKVLSSGLVTHGQGSTIQSDAVFSNVPSSYCSSEGKYSIGAAYHGRFGLAYKLHGLSKTNSNAYRRFIVLHAHDCVPDKELYPTAICQSQGCPTVSPAFLQELKTIISGKSNSILMEIGKW